MTQQKLQIAPRSQADYQSGLQDGTRYYAEGHTELWEKYQSGTHAYRIGFDAGKDSPRALDPDFAS